MRPALHAEWTKLRTISGPFWLLAAAAVLTVALSAAAAAATTCRPSECAIDAARTSLTGVQLGQAVIAILAVVAVGNEYTAGMIRTTLAATPRRSAVLAAKATVVTVAALPAAALAVLGSVLAGRLILPGNGFTAAHGYLPLSLFDGPTLRAAAGSVLYLGLIGLLSLGIAMIVRDPAVAIGVVLGLLYLFPILINVASDPDWERRLKQISPSSAGLAIQNTLDLVDPPLSPWAGLGVLALWAAGGLLVGGLMLRLRDA